MILRKAMSETEKTWKQTVAILNEDFLFPYLRSDLPEEAVTLDRCGEHFIAMAFWMTIVSTLPPSLVAIEVKKIVTKHAKHIRVSYMKLHCPYAVSNYADSSTMSIHFTGVWRHMARHSRGERYLDSPLDCQYLLTWKPFKGILNIVI